jgi:hypothetical protein
MKFFIAAGILAQTLPVISEKVSTNVAAEGNSAEFARFVVATLRAAESNSEDEFVAPALESLKSSPLDLKSCDPTSDDPDVGILSCDVGYDCVVDESSILGGVCASVTRELQVASCTLCPFSKMDPSANELAVSIPDYPGLTCGAMYYAAYINATIATDECTAAAGFAQVSGCCEGGPVYACDICAGANGTLILDALVEGDGNTTSCGAIAAFAPEAECGMASSAISPLCCGGAASSPTDAPVGTPTTVAPSGATLATPAPSGSVAVWSTSTIVSMIGLAAVTASALVLN